MGDENPISTLEDLLPAYLRGIYLHWEDLTTRFLAQFFPPGRIAKLQNDILMFQQHQEEEKSVRDNRVVGKNIVEPNKSNVAGTLEEVDREDEVGNRTNNESARNTEKDLTKEKVRELVEAPRSRPVKFYLKHKINKELIEGLVGNSRFNDSLFAMQSCKMECEAYHSLPVESIRKAMLKKMIPKRRI
ncbi:zinc finger, CCHC-type containing protein [Tanacetum coccineum]